MSPAAVAYTRIECDVSAFVPFVVFKNAHGGEADGVGKDDMVAVVVEPAVVRPGTR